MTRPAAGGSAARSSNLWSSRQWRHLKPNSAQRRRAGMWHKLCLGSWYDQPRAGRGTLWATITYKPSCRRVVTAQALSLPKAHNQADFPLLTPRHSPFSGNLSVPTTRCACFLSPTQASKNDKIGGDNSMIAYNMLAKSPSRFGVFFGPRESVLPGKSILKSYHNPVTADSILIKFYH